ncbi:rhodanese-like domain-containing protein [Methylocystis sp. JAN1]|uniref:rhodanese-like domain-containing protein n=1 Tax=Methylocystis sp. JAN1 TaxID=3397211 RepID=UPI003FA2EE5C
MQRISREQVQALMRRNASIVEVLPEKSFREAHLPGAINIPFDAAFDDRIQKALPDKEAPLVVYCASNECQLSPQAAEHLDRLGYAHVFDYKAGKADWRAASLPVETG